MCAVYLDTVISRGCDNFAGVELECSHPVVVLESFKYPAGAYIPHLKGVNVRRCPYGNTYTHSN